MYMPFNITGEWHLLCMSVLKSVTTKTQCIHSLPWIKENCYCYRNKTLGFPSHTKQASSHAVKWERVLFTASILLQHHLHSGQLLFCLSTIKAFFSCPQDLTFPEGFVLSLLVAWCYVKGSAYCLVLDLGLEKQDNSHFIDPEMGI